MKDKIANPKELKPSPYHFTKMSEEDYEKLKQSMSVSGFSKHLPIKVRVVDGGLEIVDGHHRQRAAIELGIEGVPIDIRDYETELEVIADGIQSNKDRGIVDYYEVSRAWEEKFGEYEKGKRGNVTQEEIGKRGGGFSRELVTLIRPIYPRLKDFLGENVNMLTFSNRKMLELARVENYLLREALVNYAPHLLSKELQEKATLCNQISQYIEEKVGDDAELEGIVYDALLENNIVFRDSLEALQKLVNEIVDKPIRYIPEFICGNVLKELPKIDAVSIHLIVTSPPYGSLKDYKEEGQITSLKGHKRYLSELEEVWDDCFRVLVPGGRLVVVIGDELIKSGTDSPHQVIPLHADIIEQCQGIGYLYMSNIIWQKTNVERPSGGGVFPGSYPYPRECLINQDHEYVLIFRKPGDTPPETQIQKEFSILTKNDWSSLITSIWKISGAKKTNHPAPFPEKLVTNLIKMFSFHEEIVLDPFVGSGTTCLAAMKLGRRSIGIDIKQDFIDVGKSLTDDIIENEISYRYVKED